MQLTINQAIALQKTIKERLSELRSLRSQVATERTSTVYLDGESHKSIDQTKVNYDIKFVDKKVTELENFLFLCDAAIKQSNALTRIDLEADMEKLLAPLE